MQAGAPGGLPMFPGLAARFPRLAQAGQRIGQRAADFVQNFDERHPNVANFRQRNSDMLSNVGMALLTTRPGDNAPVREAFYYGRQSDQERAAQAQAQQEEAQRRDALRQLIGGGGQAPGAGAGAGAAPGSMEPYRNAIGSMESGNNYAAIGPPADAEGHRAYGRYQVMDYNIGPWTQEVLGRAMTPEQFLNDEAAQDAVFDAKFGGYVQQYGPEGAAQAWFGGPGSVGSGGAGSDVLGTTGTGYVQRFNAALGGQGATAPPAAAQGGINGLSPEQQQFALALLEINPQAAEQYVMEAMQPRQPTYGWQEVGDTLLRTDAQGNAVPVYTADQAGADAGAFQQTRTMLGPDGTPHIFGFNPETNNYDRDQGRAPEDAPLVAFNGDEIPTPLLQNAIDAIGEAETLGVQVQELMLFRDVAALTETGFTENLTTGVRNALVSLGIINDPALPAQQVFTALQNQQALRLRNPESGFGLTGNTSDRDISFLRGAVANLSNTPQANQAVLTILLAKQRRAAALAALRSDYIFENATLAGFNEYRNQWIEENSIFTPEEQALLQGLASGQPAAPPAQGQPALPPGLTQQEWDVMTPAERALFR